MEIINKILGKNPLDEAMMERIKKKIQDILKVFGDYYQIQTKTVIIENKENEYKEKEERKKEIDKYKKNQEKYYKKRFGEDSEVPNIPNPPEKEAKLEVMTEYCNKMLELNFKPLFPRGKMEPLKDPELTIELNRYALRDIYFDPYAVYIIKSSKGDKAVERERRFKEFEKLHKALKKDLTKECVLPPASSKIGARNLNPEFLENRVNTLNEYLQKISAIESVKKNEAFLRFIGFYESPDPLGDQIFEAAFRKTKSYFCCYGDFKWDVPSDAMSKLIIKEVWYTIKFDIEGKLPKVETARKTTMKIVHTSIAKIIDTLLPPVWDTAEKASKSLRETVFKVLEKVIETIIDTKNKLNEKLKESIIKLFEPLRVALATLFSAGVHKIIPLIVGPFSYVYKTYQEKAEKFILDSFKSGDKGILEKGIDIMNKIYEDIIKKFEEKVDEDLKIILDELCNGVNYSLLKNCFFPMRVIGKMFADFIRIINPKHWSKVASTMFEYKTKLCQCDGKGVENILNEMERNSYYEMDYESWRMDNGRYALKYDIYRFSSDLDSIADVCFDVGGKVIKKVFKGSCEKFIRKFSDYTWSFSVKSDDDKKWNEKVDEAMFLAYQDAKHKFNKECGIILKEGICDILGGIIVDKLIEEIIKGVEPVFKTLDNIIPEQVKDLINIEDMAKDDIEDILTSVFEGAVGDQEKAFTEELDKAIENCQL